MLEGNLTLKYPIFVKDGYEALGQNALERAGQKSGKLQRTYITLAEDYFVKAGIPDETRELAIGSFERSAGTRYRTESRPDDSRREVYFGRLAPAMVISGLVLGILFLQSNITGNTIADMDSVSTGWGVSVLILIGVLGLFLYSRKKK